MSAVTRLFHGNCKGHRAFCIIIEEDSMHTMDHEKVRDRAYQLWDRAGQPEGRDQEFWFDAERELAEEEDFDTSEAASRVELPPVVPGILN
jgi:hypothetical protein